MLICVCDAEVTVGAPGVAGGGHALVVPDVALDRLDNPPALYAAIA